MIVPAERRAQAAGHEKALQNRVFPLLAAVSRQASGVTAWKRTEEN